MRLIKAFVVGFIGLFIIITLFSLLIPSQVRVSRGVLINTDNSGEVYRQIAILENWKNWHPIFTVDSAALSSGAPSIDRKDSLFHIKYRQQDVLISLQPADSTTVEFLMHADGENDIVNEIVISHEGSQQTVQVEWRAITKLNWYPWEKFYGIFIDKLTGPGYENALNGLKEYLENTKLSSNLNALSCEIRADF